MKKLQEFFHNFHQDKLKKNQLESLILKKLKYFIMIDIFHDNYNNRMVGIFKVFYYFNNNLFLLRNTLNIHC